MNGASAEVANDRFSTSAIVKMKAAPTRTTMSHSSNVGWGKWKTTCIRSVCTEAICKKHKLQ